MKLNQFIHSETIRRARYLDELRKHNTESSKTEQQKALDEFFGNSANDRFGVLFSQFTKIITGYAPETSAAGRENFQVMVRPQTGQVYILLKSNMYGFADLTVGYITFAAGDVRASVEQSEQFIKKLSDIGPEHFVAWIGTYLGHDTFQLTYNA